MKPMPHAVSTTVSFSMRIANHIVVAMTAATVTRPTTRVMRL